jgi:hypothetical protein
MSVLFAKGQRVAVNDERRAPSFMLGIIIDIFNKGMNRIEYYSISCDDKKIFLPIHYYTKDILAIQDN